MASNSILESMN